jgi:signal transduction histidine kinase
VNDPSSRRAVSASEVRDGVRDRFLSEFALTLAEGAHLPDLLERAVREICRLLDVDRVTLFLREPGDEAEMFSLRAGASREGVPDFPQRHASLAFLSMYPALSSGRPLVAGNVYEEEALKRARELFEQLGTRSLAMLPITTKGTLRGFLSIAMVRGERRFTAEDVSFLESAVRHLSAAVQQMELVAELGKERDRLRVLFELAAEVHRSASSHEVIAAALRGLSETLRFPMGGFAVLAPGGERLTCLAAYAGADGPRPCAVELELSEPETGAPTFVGRALASEEPTLFADVESEGLPREIVEAARPLGMRSGCVFPLRAGAETIGLLAVACDGATRSIEREDVLALQSLAGIVSAAFARARSAESAERSMREAHALADASRSLLTRTAKKDVLLKQILDALVRQFGTDNCAVLLVDRERKSVLESERAGAWSVAPSKELRIDGPGLIAWSVRNRTLVNVSDVRKDARYLPGWPECLSELVVPLVLDGEVVGAFDVQAARLSAFGEADVRMLTAFADRAVLALRVSELVAELEERTRVLEGVARATKLLNFRLNAPDVLSSFVEETSRAFPSSDGCIAYVADEHGKTLTIAAAYGLGKSTQAGHGMEPTPIERYRCAGRALLEDRPILLDVGGLDELMVECAPEVRARVRASVEDAEVRQLLAVPIRVGDRRLGVIEVLARRPGAFSPADVEVLVLLAEQAAIALRNARLIEELQRASRLKDDFLANFSHEVRTPLTGVIGWAEVLLDARGDDPQTRRATTAILRQAEALSRMLSDLIDLSRIDQHCIDMRRAEVRLSEVVSGAIEAVAPGAEKRGVGLRADLAADLPTVDGDAARLKQVVWNLLANAVKFSAPDSEVTIAARRLDAGGVELVVSDRGYGIDASFLPYVFDRFRQEETSTNRRFGGLGVGLSIARAIVLAHGGTIECASDGRGCGARFTVKLPGARSGRQPSGVFPQSVRAKPAAPPSAGAGAPAGTP